jgi:hypothetical protein
MSEFRTGNEHPVRSLKQQQISLQYGMADTGAQLRALEGNVSKLSGKVFRVLIELQTEI